MVPPKNTLFKKRNKNTLVTKNNIEHQKPVNNNPLPSIFKNRKLQHERSCSKLSLFNESGITARERQRHDWDDTEILVNMNDNLGKKLGHGTFGSAHIYRGRDEKMTVLKILILNRPGTDPLKTTKSVWNEYKIQTEIHHPNICKLIKGYVIKAGSSYVSHEKNEYGKKVDQIRTVEFKDQCVGLELEFCNSFDLEKLIKNRIRRKQKLKVDPILLIPEHECRFLLYHICKGLQYIHNEVNIIHRDLKPANIFLDFNGITIIPKIGDFGCAKKIPARGTQITNDDLNATMAGCNTLVGTALYCSRELAQLGLNKGKPDSQKSKLAPYGRNVDIWALGCIVYQMMTGEHCFLAPQSDKNLPASVQYQKIYRKIIANDDNGMTEQAQCHYQDLIGKVCYPLLQDQDSPLRKRISEVLALPWLHTNMPKILSKKVIEEPVYCGEEVNESTHIYSNLPDFDLTHVKSILTETVNKEVTFLEYDLVQRCNASLAPKHVIRYWKSKEFGVFHQISNLVGWIWNGHDQIYYELKSNSKNFYRPNLENRKFLVEI